MIGETNSPKSDQSKSSEIMHELQQKMFHKAKNYVGHNVHLKDGVLKIKKAKDSENFNKYMKREDRAKQFAKINEYVSEVLSSSAMLQPTEASVHMFNMPQSMD